MSFDIKNNKLVVKKKTTAETLTIRNTNKKTGKPTKLSEVLHFLPEGILHKEETGIGATTLELNCQRNSIIVEPIRSTAWNKAKNPKNRYPALYVGSLPEGKKQKTKEAVKEYLAANKEFKKFLVVADSLPKLLAEIENPEDYFLLLDESDSFQLNATFRDSMDICLDAYKNFPGPKAMVSATPLKFSDPKLGGERLLKLCYEHRVNREVVLAYTQDWMSSLVEIIIEHYDKRSSEKLVVALNKVSSIKQLISHLKDKTVLKAVSIKALVSEKRKDELKANYANLVNDLLPGDITFMSSAYFTGVDIMENFHLVTVVDASERTLRFSEHTIKQISGRCRNSLSSETVLYQPRKSAFTRFFTKEKLLEAAEKELAALDCISRNYDGNEVLMKSFKKVRENFISKSVVNNFKLVFEPKEKDPEISYLNIDAYLEAKRVAEELYDKPDSLQAALEASGCTVKTTTLTSSRPVPIKKNLDHEFSDALKLIEEDLQKLLSGEVGVEIFSPEEEATASGSPTTNIGAETREKIYELLEEFGPYFQKDKLITLIKGKLKSNKSHVTHSLNQLCETLGFAVEDPSSGFKADVLKTFVVGKFYSHVEVKDNMVKLITKHNLQIPKENITKELAKEKLRRYFMVKSAKNPSGEAGYKITSHQNITPTTFRKSKSLSPFAASDHVQSKW